MKITKNIIFYPLIVISLASFFQFYKYVLQVYPSIITNQLMDEFNLTGAGLGNLAATFYYTFIITQLFVGLALDKFGTRWVTSLAILACASGVFFFSYSHTAFAACICRALIGVGVAFSTVVYMKLASEWFSGKSYTFVSGLLATATMAGAVFGELPLLHLIQSYGWRNTLSILGIAGFMLTILFVLIVRDNKTNSHQRLTLNDLMSVITNKKNWLLTLYGGLAFSPISIFAGLWGNPFLQQAYNLNKAEAATMISLIFIGLGVGSPILGFVATKLKNKLQLMFYSTCIAFVSLILVLYCHSLSKTTLGILLFIFGFVLGSYLLAFTMGKEANKATVTATVIAMINAGDAIFTGLTEPLIGKILDLTSDGKLINGVHNFSLYDYQAGLSLLPIYLLISAILILYLKDKPKNISSCVNIKSDALPINHASYM